MKSINTLIPDVQKLVATKGWFDAQLAEEFARSVSKRLQLQYKSKPGETSPDKPRLRLSQMGPRCPKALWYSIHHPEMGEALPPWAEVKYSFGHMIEALAITLAKAAGHTVEGEQDALKLDGIVGHRDGVIDGCVVDVKSASSRSFIKFKNPSFDKMDNFGYLDQLDGYVLASADDPLVHVKDKGYIFAIDKQKGHMVLYEHRIREHQIKERIKYYKSVVNRNQPPPCECGTIALGKSGNVGLDTKASYSAFKHCCFPYLRTFLYSDGPVFLTKVVRAPDVPEITKYGQAVPRFVDLPRSPKKPIFPILEATMERSGITLH